MRLENKGEMKGYPGKQGLPDRPRTKSHETHKNIPFMLRQILFPEKERRRAREDLWRRAQTEKTGLAAGRWPSLVPDSATGIITQCKQRERERKKELLARKEQVQNRYRQHCWSSK